MRLKKVAAMKIENSKHILLELRFPEGIVEVSIFNGRLVLNDWTGVAHRGREILRIANKRGLKFKQAVMSPCG